MEHDHLGHSRAAQPAALVPSARIADLPAALFARAGLAGERLPRQGHGGKVPDSRWPAARIVALPARPRRAGPGSASPGNPECGGKQEVQGRDRLWRYGGFWGLFCHVGEYEQTWNYGDRRRRARTRRLKRRAGRGGGSGTGAPGTRGATANGGARSSGDLTGARRSPLCSRNRCDQVALR